MASLIIGALLTASATVMASSVPEARAEGRTLSVTPAQGLTNEVVRVTWSGFRPTFPDGTYGVQIYQCKADPQRLADCNAAEAFPAAAEGNKLIGFTSEDGTGAIDFEVRPAAQLPELDCSQASPCSILAFENDAEDPPSDDALPTTAVTAPLSFARSQADCPSVSDFDLRADGSSSAAPLFYRWAADLCAGEDALVLDYTDTSSTTGRENFLNGLVDIGISAIPPTEEELENAPDHPEFTYAPVSLTGVAVVVNMVDLRTNRRVENLVLTPRLVARLITNSDLSTFLSDPELRILNPQIAFPTSFARPLLRAERDSDSQLVTEWMTSTQDARDFLADRDRFGRRLNPAYLEYVSSYPSEGFEVVDSSDDQYVPRTGQRNVALRMFYRVAPAGSVPESTLTGFIGVVDLPTARRFALPTAKIVNAAGNAVAPTDAALLAGFAAMKRTPAGTLQPDLTSRASEAYPLVKVDYALVPTDAPADTIRKTVRLLRHVAGPGQSQLPRGFLPLPQSLKDQTAAVATLLAAIADPPATTTTTTTPTTPPPTAPPVDPYPVDSSGGSYDSYSPAGDLTGSAPGEEGQPTPTTAARVRTTTTTGFGLTTSTIGPPALPTPGAPAIPTAMGLSGMGAMAWGALGLAQRKRASTEQGSGNR